MTHHVPQWSSYFIPTAKKYDSDSDSPPGLAVAKKKKGGKERLRVTNGGDDTDNSMPGLQSVSNTSDEDMDDDESEFTDEEEEEDDDESDGESGYNTEEEDERRDLLREAMDVAHEADFLDSGVDVPPELDPFRQEDRKGNPFIKLLGSLRGAYPFLLSFTVQISNVFCQVVCSLPVLS